MTSRLFLGRLVRLVGRRRLMIASVALSAVRMAAVGFPLHPAAMAVLVVLLGLGLGVGQPLTMSWLAEMAPAGLRGRAMSLRLTGNRLGQVLIPSAVGLVAAGVGAAGVLWATAGGARRRRGRRPAAQGRRPPRAGDRATGTGTDTDTGATRPPALGDLVGRTGPAPVLRRPLRAWRCGAPRRR